jgi:hypothetical protein
MLKNNFKLMHVMVDRDDYAKLEGMQTEQFPSVAAIIRDLIRMAIQSKMVEVKPIELKPMESLQNPVNMEIKKTPLEVPVIDNSSITESASLVHKLERTFKPQMRDVMIAKRARDAGRAYDKNLEPFFKDLNG